MNDLPDFQAERFEEIFKIAEHLRQLRYRPNEFTVGSYKSLLADLCGALRHAHENGLDDIIRYVGGLTNDQELRAEAKRIVANLDRFSEFTVFQEEHLLSAGVSKEVAQDLKRHVTLLRSAFTLKKSDPHEMVTRVADYRDQTCAAADQSEKYVADEAQKFKNTQTAVRIYGTVFIIASAGAMVATAGASAPFSVAGAGFGGLLLTWDGKLTDPTQRPICGLEDLE